MWASLLLLCAQASEPWPLRAVWRDGTPAAGALVRTFRGEPFRRKLRELPEVRLDAAGTCVLVGRPDFVEVTAATGGSGMVAATLDGAGFLELRDQVALTGLVVDAAGSPVAGATVVALPFQDRPGEPGVQTARAGWVRALAEREQAPLMPAALPVTTAADGSFVLPLLRGGRYVVSAHAEHHSAPHDITARPDTVLRLTVAADLEIAGVVRDPTGAVLPGAVVRLVSGVVDRRVRADLVGCYRARLVLDGPLAVAASVDQFQLGVAAPRPVALDPSQRVYRCDVTTASVTSLVAVLPAGPGAPAVSPRFVLIAAATDPTRLTAADAEFGGDGTLRIPRLLPGEYRIVIPGAQVDQVVSVRQPSGDAVSLQPAAATVRNIDLVLRRRDGSIVELARVAAVAAGLHEERDLPPSRWSAGQASCSAQLGRRLLVVGPDTAPWLSEPVAADGPDQVECALSVATMRVLVRAEGWPFPADVCCDQPVGGEVVLRRTAHTDADGACRIGAAPGEHLLVARSRVDGRLLGGARVQWDGRSDVVLDVDP